MSLIGLDIGTTGCKAIVFEESGAILGQASREYPILTPQPHWAEQDAEQVWQLALQSLKQAVQTAGTGDSPKAMALSVQGEAIIPVDRQGNPLRHAILGMDTRTGAENKWLAQQLGAEKLFNRTGMPLHTINTLPKLLWLKMHEPEIWKQADQFLLYEDYMIRRLSGRAMISHCLASRTQMYDLHNGGWAGEILDACGIGAGRLAPLSPDKVSMIGVLRPKLALELGLPNEVALVSGGHDQACAALGSGVIEAGRAMVSTGTAEVVEVAMDSPALSDALRRGNISIYRHVVPGLYLAMTLNHSGGLLLRWFRDSFCELQILQAKESGSDAYDLVLKDAPEGPASAMVLPHFAGSGTPWLDTSSKGAILGLSFADRRSTVGKAILEGLAFELRVNLDLLKESGVSIQELHAVGGGAKSALWLQLKADICRIPLQVPQVTEAACLGAALLAGTGVGVYSDLRSAVAQTVKMEKRVEPDANCAEQYNTRYELYKQLYSTLIPLLRQM